MLCKRSALAVICLALLEQATALVSPATTPTAFDGQYVTNPPPSPSNQAVEWWWFQALGEEVNGVIPSIQANFYAGFAFTLGPKDPRWRFDVNVVFPNGTSFFVSTPVVHAPNITTKGQAVIGDWAGLGRFALSGDRKRLVLTFHDEQNGLTGSVTYDNLGTPAHVPCSKSASAPPYFSQLAAGKHLNAAEKILYEQTGWAVTMPRAAVNADVRIGGSQFYLANVHGYHDHNWAPEGLDKFAYTWVTGQGSCGPYDLGYLEVQALKSNRPRDILQGTLAYGGEFLQVQCGLFGEHRRADTIDIELTGQATDAVTGQQVPTGLKLDYTLANGTHYVFNLHNSVESPSQVPYHRWTLGGSGGRVGGPQYDCLLIGDWLNPGLANYSTGTNIFDTQHS